MADVGDGVGFERWPLVFVVVVIVLFGRRCSQPRALPGVNSLDNLPGSDYESYRFNVKSLI